MKVAKMGETDRYHRQVGHEQRYRSKGEKKEHQMRMMMMMTMVVHHVSPRSPPPSSYIVRYVDVSLLHSISVSSSLHDAMVCQGSILEDASDDHHRYDYQ